MEKKAYVAGKTGKMAMQTGSTNVVALAVYYAVKRLGFEMSPDEVVVYMMAFNVVGTSIIKLIEKLKK